MSKKISKYNHKALTEYIEHLTENLMNLKDWSFVLKKKYIEENHVLGKCGCVFGQKIFVISFGKDFFELDEPDQIETIVHELCHVHQWGVEEAVVAISKAVEEEVYQVHQYSYQLAREYEVDAFAKIIAKQAPPMSKKLKKLSEEKKCNKNKNKTKKGKKKTKN